MAETETETQETETAAAPAANATGNTRFPLPDGIVTPIQVKNHLVQKGHAPKDTKPQVFYTFVNSSSPKQADPFPVKHYEEDGTAHDVKGGPDGNKVTRPGLVLEDAVAWFLRRKERLANKGTTEGSAATSEAAAPADDAQVEAAQTAAAGSVSEQAGDEVEDGDFAEVE
jgi:hypothetical protein